MTVGRSLREIYAPSGTLRVALNHGNRVLVSRAATGRPVGISVDLAHALAEAIVSPLRFVEFDRAIDVSATADQDVWDLCFLAVDPQREETIGFTAPYVRISGCYLVADGIDAEDSAAVVTRGLRVGVVDGSAYTLHLARQPGAGHLIVLPNIDAAFAAMNTGRIDAVAGIEQAMAAAARERPGSRVLQPPFMQIQQAMGVPAARHDALDDLRGYLARLARSGVIAAILERHGVSRECAVMP